MSPSAAVANRPADPPVEQTAITLVTESLKQEGGAIRAFLPSDEHRQRFLRIVLKAVQDNPDLAQCTPDSIASAAVEAAMYGLEPSGAVGGAHLVPFNENVGSRDKPRWEKHAKLITDYRGDIELARSSGKVEDAYAVIVRAKDHFRYDAGNQVIEHEPDLAAPQTPNPDETANPMTHVYAVVVHRSGYRRPEVMSKAQVDAVRASAPGGNGPAWRNHYLEMAKKTVLKRALKTAPLPPALKAIITREDELAAQPVTATVHEPRTPLANRLAERRQQQLTTGEATEQPGTEAEPHAHVDTAPSPASPEPADEAREGDSPREPAPAAAPAAASSPPGDGSPASTSRRRRTSRKPAVSEAPPVAAPEAAPAGNQSQPVASPLGSWIATARADFGFEEDDLRAAIAETFDGLPLEDLSPDEWETFTAMATDYAILPMVGTDAYRALPVARKSKIRALTEERRRAGAKQSAEQNLAAAQQGTPA